MSMAATIDIDTLRRHVGKTVEEHDVATAAPLHGLIVTFDRDDLPPQEGDVIQPGWHDTRKKAGVQLAPAFAELCPTLLKSRKKAAASTCCDARWLGALVGTPKKY